MTAKELAAMIDGREAGYELTADEERKAAESGLVVLYTPRADLTLLSGAIRDCVEYAYDYDSLRVVRDGLLPSNNCKSMEECRLYQYVEKHSVAVLSVFRPCGVPYCTFTADIPHESFETYVGHGADRELYCVGMVFRMEDIPGGRKGDSHEHV